MKSNEAPEKIYIFETDLQREDHRVMYGINQDNNIHGLVEYTRTDAFIEKALKFIDYTFHGTSIEGWGGENVDVVMSDASVYKDDLFENFKNYMKGE